MPKLDLTVPADVLSDDAKQKLARDLGATLLKAEGAPDTEFFRSITWAHIHELPADAIQTPDGVAEPHVVVDVTVPDGALSDRRRGVPWWTRPPSMSPRRPAGGRRPGFASGS